MFVVLVLFKYALQLLDHIAADQNLTAVRGSADSGRSIDHRPKVVHAVVHGIDLTYRAAPVHTNAHAESAVQECAVVGVDRLGRRRVENFLRPVDGEQTHLDTKAPQQGRTDRRERYHERVAFCLDFVSADTPHLAPKQQVMEPNR